MLRFCLVGVCCGLAWVAPAARADPLPVKYRAAVRKGLAWLATQQARDGHWETPGRGYPVSVTALAGMSFLMEGSTTTQGRYARQIRKARDWLLAQAQPNGLIADPNTSEMLRPMFGHGYAMLFLASDDSASANQTIFAFIGSLLRSGPAPRTVTARARRSQIRRKGASVPPRWSSLSLARRFAWTRSGSSRATTAPTDGSTACRPASARRSGRGTRVISFSE